MKQKQTSDLKDEYEKNQLYYTSTPGQYLISIKTDTNLHLPHFVFVRNNQHLPSTNEDFFNTSLNK
jgi:hypothetical protein